MSRGGRRGKGFGAAKLGANSIEMPDNIDIDCHEILLFPLHDTIPFKRPNQEEFELYSIGESFRHRMRASLYYSEPEKPKPEVVQYSHKYLEESVKADFRSEIAKINFNLDFFPYELHTAVTTKKRKKVDTDKQEIDLDKLEALEKEEVLDKSRDSLSNALAKEDGGESGDEVDEEVDEMESDMDDDNDYAIDHYDDELDALGSDGGGEDY